MLDLIGSPRGAAVALLLISVLWMAQFVWSGLDLPTKPDGQTTVFGDSPNAAERYISIIDGRHFAQLATDPLYRDTIEGFRGVEERAAYRSLRPVSGWAYWAGSLGGRRPLIAPVMLASTALAIAALPLALAAAGRAYRRVVRYPALVILAPGVLANLYSPGMAEPMATTFVLGGLALWVGGRRRAAVLIFCIAALTRETTLAIPAGLALAELIPHLRLKRALPLLLPLLTYLAWSVFVSIRVGSTGDLAQENALSPISGLIEVLPHWNAPEYLSLAGFIVAVILIIRLREPQLTAIAVVHVVLFLGFGTPVLLRWWAFGRVLLPIYVLALIGPRLATGVGSMGDRSDPRRSEASKMGSAPAGSP